MQKMLPFSPKKGALHIKTGLFSFDVAGAVGTAGRVLFHDGLAVGALAGGFLHGFFLVQQLVHGLHQQEYAEGDDEEVKDVLQKRAVIHRAHTGGLSGPAVFPVAVRMVWQASQRVKIPVVGLGGIAAWQDAVEMLLAGATALQIGTVLFTDPYAPVKILEGLNRFLDEEGLSSVTELTGGIRPW